MKKRRYEHNALFRPGPDWHLNAAVGDNGGPYTFRAYADGFFQAARYIADAVIQNPFYADLVIYPLAFNYRHGIELSLKGLVLHSSAALGLKPEMKKSHGLMDNWKRYRDLAMKLDPAIFEPKIELGILGDILDDFVQIDPTGQAFRYPEDVMGNRHLVKQSHINIRVLAEGMSIVHEVFQQWSDRTAERYEINAL